MEEGDGVDWCTSEIDCALGGGNNGDDSGDRWKKSGKNRPGGGDNGWVPPLPDIWDFCGAFNYGPQEICSESTWNLAASNLSDALKSAGHLVDTGQKNYDLDAIGLGFSGSAGFSPWQIGGGVDGIYIFESNEFAAYDYAGPSGTVGAGGAGGPNLILAFNIDNSVDYTGVSNVLTGTYAWGLVGISASYFWGGKAPLKPGTPQGITLGWSPGAELSVSLSQLAYNLIGAYHVKTR